MKIDHLKYIYTDSVQRLEDILRNLRFITNRDTLSLLKYNQLTALNKIENEFNSTSKDFLNAGICVCDEQFTGKYSKNMYF